MITRVVPPPIAEVVVDRVVRKPSLVMAIAVGAVVVVAAGSAVAVPSVHAAINGKAIKNHSIIGKKLVNNTVTGKQVKESTLGTVPHAGTATTSGTALNAQKLGGQSASAFVPSSRLFTFSASMAKGDPQKELGTFGPLTFSATCTADAGNTSLVIFLTTSVDNTFVAGPTSATLQGGDQFTILLLDSAGSAFHGDQSLTVFVPDGSFSVDDANVSGLINGPTGHACVFAGHLLNDAG
jgi:hypothetical protein